jgi:predicted P-loop ATPase
VVAREAERGGVSRDLVQAYIDRGFQLVFWPATADWKGPREADWITKKYTVEDYKPGYRVGIMHGVEVAPGRHLVDVDIDWGPGVEVAKAMLPVTQFIWGRASKRVSHCLYTTPDVMPMYAYKDVGKDGITLIEFRADKHQSMAPPSIWEKEGKREQLAFVVDKDPTLVESALKLKQRVCLAAIGMLLAKHFGKNGFGHEPRLCWAGFLLRAGISIEDLVLMGNAISVVCNNTEVGDVRRVVESTAASLAVDGKKVKGGPALAKLLGEAGKAVVGRINEWIGRDSDFVRNQQGVILAKHQGNVRRAVELLEHELSYDDFAGALLIDGKKMEDREVNSLLTQIEIEFHFQPPENYFERVIKFLAWQNAFHPVKDYLATLTWDKVPRIDTWLVESGGVEDNEYTRAVSSIMLIAGVRRIRHPGCKYDEMVVWESSTQGTEKSSAAQALCPNPAWLSDDLPLILKSQQLIEATLGKWIVEASDLAGKRKAEIEQLKATLSRQVDGPARMAYAHFPVERPRHFIIIGTTNSTAYLTDPTGARRFWPLTIGRRFKVDWINKHRDQLWAEACVREAAGESIRLPERLWPHAATEQEKRREIDPWELVIRSALQVVIPGSGQRRRVTTEALWNALNIQVDRRDRFGALRISEIMSRLGFKRTRVRPHGEEVQVGYIQMDDTFDVEAAELPDDEKMEREPGSDDTPF